MQKTLVLIICAAICPFVLAYAKSRSPHDVAQLKDDSSQVFLKSYILSVYIPDKIRNATCRTDQLSGRSQVMFIFVQRYVRYCYITYHLQHGVKNVYTKIGQKPSRGQIVKSQKSSVFIMLSCWISPSNRNLLSRPNGTQTHILCKFYL